MLRLLCPGQDPWLVTPAQLCEGASTSPVHFPWPHITGNNFGQAFIIRMNSSMQAGIFSACMSTQAEMCWCRMRRRRCCCRHPPLPRWRAGAFLLVCSGLFPLSCSISSTFLLLLGTLAPPAELSASEPCPQLLWNPCSAPLIFRPGGSKTGRRCPPTPQHPVARSRQRAPLGWPAAPATLLPPATARLQFTAPSAPPAGLLRHG